MESYVYAVYALLTMDLIGVPHLLFPVVQLPGNQSQKNTDS